MFHRGVTIHDVLPRLVPGDELRDRLRALTVLDAAFGSAYPFHMFEPEWRPGVAMGSMENGGGDSYGVVFDPAGVFLFGFDHESPVTPWRDEDREPWPGLLDGMPAALARWPEDEELRFEGFFDATACAWWTAEAGWACGPVRFDDDEDDGADWMFERLLVGDAAAAYADWASDYYSRQVGADDVRWAFEGRPVTRSDAEGLGGDWERVAAEAGRVGYPLA